MAEPTGVETPADDTAYFDPELVAETDELDGENAPSEYTTESPEASAPRTARRPVVTGHANGLGRRKEAIARVRIVPGTGQWKINGRTLEAYFPNKVHQQIVSEPFVTLGAEGNFDVIAAHRRRWRLRSGRRAAAWRGPCADACRPGEPAATEEGRIPHPGRPGDGAEEVRTQEGP